MKRIAHMAFTVAITTLAVTAAVTAAAAGRGQLDPIRAPEEPSTRTRAEVQAEAAEALKNGRYVRGQYVPHEAPAGAPMTRAQVIAEMLEHRRLGLTPRGNHYPLPTPAQAEQIRQAGLRALQNDGTAQSAPAPVHQH